MQKRSFGSMIFTIIFWIIVLISLMKIYSIYKVNYFNDFIKAEYVINTSEFKRDSNIKYDKYDSYSIISNEYNDAMFFKTINVIPNTAYKVSCMIKTEGVETQKESSIAGAGICIADTTECSAMITGTTNEWQKVEMLFNSKNRTQVDIGFRLGSYNDNCKGTAWFSNLKLEMGSREVDTHWKMACFIIKNLDVNIEIEGKQEHVSQKISKEEIEGINENIKRAQDSIKLLSNSQMTMEYEIIEIDAPVTNVTYEVENGYYLSPSDVAKFIEPYILNGDYDYIYTVVKFGNLMHNDIENEVDWLGLRWDGLFRHRVFKYKASKQS